VLPALIDEHGGGAAGDEVESAAGQKKAERREVVNHPAERQADGKVPGLVERLR
jgi:hypothetical protein